MKKILLLTIVIATLVAFVGVDVVKSAVHRARTAVQDALTANVPLRTQLAEAQAQVDAYAESVIRGEVAAENLAEMIGDVRREVRGLERRVERERQALEGLRRDLEVVPTAGGGAPTAEEREAHRQARLFRAHGALLERRRQDLARLEAEHAATLASLEEARAEQVRLAEEVQVLAAEIESLEARTAAARTREAVGDVTVSSSGYAEAQARLREIRTAVRERNKLLEYYEYERRPVAAAGADPLPADEPPESALEAVEDALATWPAR